MATIQGSVPVTGFIAPPDSLDVLPTHLEDFGKGGYRSVSTLTDRDNVPAERRKEGMLVNVISEDKFYKLTGGILNTHWEEFSLSGGASITVDAIPTNDSMNPVSSDGVFDALALKASSTHNHNGVYEPANANIQSHITSISNPHNTTAGQVGAYTQTETDTKIGDAINALISAAPSALDTLNELAAALGDDPQFATTVLGKIAEVNQKFMDMNEPSGFLRDQPATTGIIELCPSGTTIYSVDSNGALSIRNDGKFATGTPYETPATDREFAIYPNGSDYKIYIEGKLFVISILQKVTIPNQSGLQYIHHTSTGTLAVGATFSFEYFEGTPVTSVVYGNATSNELVLFGDERHGVGFPGWVHRVWHFTFGTMYVKGMEIQGLVSGQTTFGAVSSGEGYDEDIFMTPPLQTVAPTLYLSGTSWRIEPASNSVAYLVGGIAQYNLLTGSTYSLANVTGDDAMIVFFALTNNKLYPYVKLLGQKVYVNTAAARTDIVNALSSLSTVGLPSPEFLPIGAVIVRSTGAIQTLADGSLYYDLRGINGSGKGTSSNPVSSHQDLLNLLGGLPALSEYYHLSSGNYLELVGGNEAFIHHHNSRYVAKNSDIVAGTKTKITYDAKGLVTGGSNLLEADIPTLSQAKITNLTTDLSGKAPVAQTMHIGTTPVAINRTSAPIDLEGISIDGNAGTATKLQTARTINGVSFDGTQDIVIGTGGGTGAVDSVNGMSGVVVLTKAHIDLGNVDNTADAVKDVLSATKLTTARNITATGDATGTFSFDGTLDGALDLVLKDSGVIDGVYAKVTVDTKGLVVAGGVLEEVDIPLISQNKVANLDVSLNNKANYDQTMYIGNTALGINNPMGVLALTGVSIDGNSATATKLETARTISVSGDITGSIPFDGTVDSDIVTTLADSGVVVGTYTKVTTDSKGRVVVGENLLEADIPSLDASKITTGTLTLDTTGNSATATKLQTARTISVSGDVTGSVSFDGTVDGDIISTLADSGVIAGTYTKVTTDSKGRAVAGGSLLEADIPELPQSRITNLETDFLNRALVAQVMYVGTTPIALNNPSSVMTLTGISIDGNALTATTLETARTINGVLFDGSSNIVIEDTTKILLSEKGAIDGIATLDATGKVPATQLPSYVSEVLEFATLSAFPAVGAGGIIYVTQDTNRTYRWSGTTYIEISAGGGATVDSVNGRTGAVTLTKTDVGLSNVDNSADINKSVLEATKLKTARTISTTGDATGSGSFNGTANLAIALTLANSGVTAGSYAKVTVDAKGRVTSGTTLADTDLPSVNIAVPVSSATQTTSGIRSIVAQFKILVDNIANLFTNKLDKNTAITGATKAKITYDAKGLVTGGTDLIAADIPSLDASKITTGTLTRDTTGNAATATKLLTARTINGVSFDGTANITVPSTVSSVNTKTGAVVLTKTDIGLANVDNTSDATKEVLSATKLKTARTINGVSFDGTANIAVIPSGGTTGDVLTKQSATPFDTYWTTPPQPVFTFKETTADETTNEATMMLNILELTFNLDPNSVYKAMGFLTFTSSSTTGYALGAELPTDSVPHFMFTATTATTTTANIPHAFFPSGTVSTNLLVTAGSVPASNTNVTSSFHGFIKTTSGGEFITQFRSINAGTFITLKTGSVVILEKIQ